MYLQHHKNFPHLQEGGGNFYDAFLIPLRRVAR
jgi:hypothetical protein